MRGNTVDVILLAVDVMTLVERKSHTKVIILLILAMTSMLRLREYLLSCDVCLFKSTGKNITINKADSIDPSDANFAP